MASRPRAETRYAAWLYLQEFIGPTFCPEPQQVLLLSEQGEQLFSDDPTDITGKEMLKTKSIYPTDTLPLLTPSVIISAHAFT